MLICGIDEAGRGPILGNLVIVALTVDEEGEKKLRWLGVKDSKLLSSSAREEFFDQIREIVSDFRIQVIEPDAIDMCMREADSNLNWLEADAAASMVSELAPNKAIIDCPSVNIPAYTKYLAEKLDPAVRDKVELVVEHKADVNHTIVSAASIVAKVIRDRGIDNLKEKIGVDFGSGYLSDPKTQDFLNNYHDKYPELFRRMWQPYRDLMDGKKQKKLGDF